MMSNLSMTVSYYKATVMTEIIIAEKINKIGGRRMHKDSLRIDMTPMVDLGFLLIAFFIFTTEISKPAITNLYMPQTGDSIKIQESKSLTILLPGSDEIFYYFSQIWLLIYRPLPKKTWYYVLYSTKYHLTFVRSS